MSPDAASPQNSPVHASGHPTPTSSLSRRSLLRFGGAVGLAGSVTAGLGSLPPAAAETGRTRIDYLDLDRTTGTARSVPGTTGTQVAELTAPDSGPFSTLAVTWAAADGLAPEVLYRTRRDGSWSDWAPLGDGPVGGAEGSLGARDGTDPVFVGDCDGVAVRVLAEPGTEVEAPQLVLIDPQRQATDAALPAPRSELAAAAAMPDLTWRGGWGGPANSSCRGPNSTLQAAIIHHTAGTNSYTEADSAQIVRGILAYHAETLGWCDIGYNFLIDKWGRIFEGRDGSVESNAHGAHAGSWNTDTVGISFMGNYETASATSAMMESAAQVAAWKLSPYDRDPNSRVTLAGTSIYRVAGHRDVMATACPGKNVVSKMAALRDRTAALIG